MALDETSGESIALKANGSKRPPKSSMPPQLRMTADKQKKRLATMQKVRKADRVSSAFLFDIGEKLGLKQDVAAKKLGISTPRFYYYRTNGFAPDFVLAKANAMLREKGLPQIAATPPQAPGSVAAASAASSASAAGVGTGMGKGKVAYVSAAFLIGLEDKLGVETSTMCTLLGTRESTLKTWRRTGQCPVWLRAAVNGLLAERKTIDTERKAAKKHVAANPDMETLIVSVPKDQVRMACAMFSACGFIFRSEG